MEVRYIFWYLFANNVFILIQICTEIKMRLKHILIGYIILATQLIDKSCIQQLNILKLLCRFPQNSQQAHHLGHHGCTQNPAYNGQEEGGEALDRAGGRGRGRRPSRG